MSMPLCAPLVNGRSHRLFAQAQLRPEHAMQLLPLFQLEHSPWRRTRREMEEQDRISDISEVISRLEAWAGSYKKSTDDGTTWDAETRIVTNDRDTNMTTEKRKQTVRSWHC